MDKYLHHSRPHFRPDRHGGHDERFFDPRRRDDGEFYIDTLYDKIIKVPDVLYDCQIPENKILKQPENTKTKTEVRGQPNVGFMKAMFRGIHT